ncbi:hypothetical protein RHGRI_023930 [Rhododendron griersonianum]|uniref:Enhancer of polycomb-like N-terminal domain-containing protein n=1 Tax=Rhododendron griersonianum TaxID=479676 RepID=A0AAV6JAN8_9ERIC|nr:hypothetical protein RHGRI_023930 [Rhododendron griersonianum]
MNGKAFPMYENWQILFGIDRATGDFAEDAADLDNCDPVESPNQDEISNIDDYLEECYTPRFANGEAIWPGDTFADLSYANTPTTNSNANANTPTTNSNANIPTTYSNANATNRANANARAKANSNARANVNANPNARVNANIVPMPPKKKAKKEVAIPEALGNYLTQSATVMEKIADAIGYDKQLSSRRERVFDELLKLDMDEDDRLWLEDWEGSLITYGANLKAKERESLKDLWVRTAAQFSDRQDEMSSIMPLFIWRGQWREPYVVNDYMGSLDGGAYQEKYQHIPVLG